MSPPLPTFTDREHASRKLTEVLRDGLSSGLYRPGDRFPSTAALAYKHSASVSTVHKALVALAKEGWIERINGAGTFVAHGRRLFTCAGIYHGMDISSNIYPAFQRNLHSALLAAFARAGKTTELFVDTRPLETQVELFPALVKAITQQRIQALVAPNIYAPSLPSFLRLNIPTAFLAASAPQSVDTDEVELFRESARRLAAAGCRSVGLLTSRRMDFPEFFERFREETERHGIETRDEWIRHPVEYVQEETANIFGYGEFIRFWRLPEKPDALIVHPDAVMTGFIAAVLELGWREVTAHLKFVLHRNAHTNFLCPFPALWAVSNEDRWADAMVQMVIDQYEGRDVAPVYLPYEFHENVPPSLDLTSAQESLPR